MIGRPTKRQLVRWHGQWLSGRTKNEIEREELDNPRAHGKLITKMWRDIGLETEAEHPLVSENRRLRSLLADAGIDVEDS